MNDFDRVPIFRGEELYIPFVGAIIEREKNGEAEVLIQIREKGSDPVYSGSIEIPGGKFRAFEDVYDTVRREVKEECGLKITLIRDEDERVDYKNRGHASSLIRPFCVTQMREGPFIGMIFLCRAKGKPVRKTAETKDARWMKVDKLKELVEKSPERIYTAFLAPLKKYIKEYE